MLKEANWNLPVPVPNLLTLYCVFFYNLDPDPYTQFRIRIQRATEYVSNADPEQWRQALNIILKITPNTLRQSEVWYRRYVTSFLFFGGQILQNSDIPVPWSKRSKQVFGTGTVPFYFEQCCGVGRSRYFWPEPVGGSGSGSNLDEKNRRNSEWYSLRLFQQWLNINQKTKT